MNQHQQILEYITEFGSISPMEAFSDLGITKLSTRISELRRNGVNIVGTMEKQKNRFGNTVYFARYRYGIPNETI